MVALSVNANGKISTVQLTPETHKYNGWTYSGQEAALADQISSASTPESR